MSVMTEKVTHVHHWNDNLFSFRTTRDPGYRFKNGVIILLNCYLKLVSIDPLISTKC